MAARSASFGVRLALQLAVAAFFVTLGIQGVQAWDSSAARLGRSLGRLFGQADDSLELAVAILEIAAGCVVLATAFVRGRSRAASWASLAVAVLWVIQIIRVLFVRNLLEPDVASWLNQLCVDLLVLVSLWIARAAYA